MTLSYEEHTQVLKDLVRCNIDLNQAINYALNRDYKPTRKNMMDVLESLGKIIQKIED